VSIRKFTVSRDDNIYEAFPDLVLLPSGKLICVFLECTYHGDHSYTRIMLTDSLDRGRTWTAKRPLTPSAKGSPYWDYASIALLKDGQIAALSSRVIASDEKLADEKSLTNDLWFSSDEGKIWNGPDPTPALGIMPGKLLELPSGRWIISCHYQNPVTQFLEQRLWYSDNKSNSWKGLTGFLFPAVIDRLLGSCRVVKL